MKNTVKNPRPATYKRAVAPKETSKLMSVLKSNSGFAAAIGLFLSRAAFLGSMAPLGLAWYAVCGALDKSSIVAAGCLLGAFFAPVGIVKIKYICATFVFWVINKYAMTNKKESPAVFCTTAAGVLLVCGLLFEFIKGFSALDIILCFTESAILWLCGIIFSKAADVMQRRGKVLSDDESIAAAILLGAAIAGTSGISLFGLRLSNAVSMYIILFCAYRGGVSISGAVGAALGLIAGLCHGDAPALTGVFAFVGLVSGVMNIFGKWGVCLSALFSNALFAAYYSSSSIIFINVLEVIIASAAFFASPDSAMDFLQRYSIKTRSFDSAPLINLKINSLTNEAFTKIHSLLSGVREAFTACGISETRAALPAVLCDRVCSRVCDRCNLRRYCWGRNFSATSRMVTKLCTAVSSGMDGEVRSIVGGKCIRSENLVNCAYEIFDIASREVAEKEKARLCIETAFDGWERAMNILDRTEETVCSDSSGFETVSGEITRNICDALGKPCCASAVTNFRGMPEVSVLTEKEFAFDPSDIISDAVGVSMYLVSEQPSPDGCITKFLPEETFCFETATVCMDNCKKNTSGDHETHFVTEEGYLYCVICDGMGSGADAAKDSEKTVEVFKKLAGSGMDMREIAKIINAGIITSWGDERCVSADFLKVDLFSGDCELVKLGAAATVAKLDGIGTLFENTQVPMGILNYENIDSKLFFVKNDAYIVLMTDGVPDSRGDRSCGEAFVKNVVEACGEMGAKELADTVLMSSVTGGNPKDDMLVTVIKLYRR